MNQEKIGKFIALLRKEKKLTQVELGEKIGVSGKAVSKWERGICLPDANSINALTNFFNISITQLYDASYEKIRENSNINFNKNNTKLFFIKKHKTLIFIIALLAFIFILTITTFSIINTNKNSTKTIYNIISDNEDYAMEGNIILSKNNTALNLFNLTINDLDSASITSYTFEYYLYIDDILILKNGDIYSFENNKDSKDIEKISLGNYAKNIRIDFKNDISRLISDKDLSTSNLTIKINYIDINLKISSYKLTFKIKQI